MKKTKYKIHSIRYKQGFTVQLTIINSEHGRQEGMVTEARFYCHDSGYELVVMSLVNTEFSL